VRYASTHKQETHRRILAAAASLFRKRGYASTGVDAVMASARLTAGGFYAHFKSKETLLARALEQAFHDSTLRWPARLSGKTGREWVAVFTSFYLSPEHRDHPEVGCPMPGLAAEVARLGPAPRDVFDRHHRTDEAVARQIDPDATDSTGAVCDRAFGGRPAARAGREESVAVGSPRRAGQPRSGWNQ
jgi:TetR/AcrR family transcriptional repressor of nem operon